MRQMITRILGAVLATLLLIASAYANAVFEFGNHPQPNEQNILFHTPQTGTSVNGFTNHTDTMVVFTSPTTLTAKGGQSDIDALSGKISDILITVPGENFLDYILNPFKGNNSSDITVTVKMSDGKSFTSPSFGHSGGNNFLTILATGGE